jgi:hypothetical protein
MTFTGTLIEELMATVERAELRAQSDEPLFAQQMAAEPMFVGSMLVEPSLVQPWFASVQVSAEYDSKFFGVA